MDKIVEYLVYASQCGMMAEWSINDDDKVHWRNLATLWLKRAMEEVETEKGVASAQRE